MEANEVYVSHKKPAINYVLAVQTQANQSFNTIIICGRGNNINKAVDVAQIAVNRYMEEYPYEVGDVNIGTDTFELDSGKERNVSTIKICLRRIK